MSLRGDLLNVLRAEARDADLKLYLKPKALTLFSFANVNNTCKSTRLCLQLVFMRCKSGSLHLRPPLAVLSFGAWLCAPVTLVLPGSFLLVLSAAAIIAERKQAEYPAANSCSGLVVFKASPLPPSPVGKLVLSMRLPSELLISPSSRPPGHTQHALGDDMLASRRDRPCSPHLTFAGDLGLVERLDASGLEWRSSPALKCLTKTRNKHQIQCLWYAGKQRN